MGKTDAEAGCGRARQNGLIRWDKDERKKAQRGGRSERSLYAAVYKQMFGEIDADILLI